MPHTSLHTERLPRLVAAPCDDEHALTASALQGAGLIAWRWVLANGECEVALAAWHHEGLALPHSTEPAYLSLVFEADRPAMQLAFEHTLAGQPPRQPLDHRLKLEDGHWQWMRLSARLLQGREGPCLAGTLGQRPENLADADRFARLFHASPYPSSVTERATGRFIEVNPCFCETFGWPAEETLGRTAEDLSLRGNDQQRRALLIDLEADGRVEHREVLGRRRSGELVSLEVNVEPIQFNGLDCLLLTTRDVTLLKLAEAQVRHLAYHDPLTNLPNRALLMERLAQQVADAKRLNLRGALLFLDLDHFKHINDSLGHPVGDTVLKVITARLEASMSFQDTVARLGGDEFVVLISGLAGNLDQVTQAAQHTADSLRELLAQPMTIEGQRLLVTPSIGIALIPDHGTHPADLLKRADIALYRAKDSGRNTAQLFHGSMQEAASERLRLENDLRLASARGEFHLHVQPQVDARHNRIVGAEVLLRWLHPQLGQQSPAQFIQVLEESGMILEVGNWILDQACSACARLLGEGLIDPEAFSLCVNISPRQFRQADFVERIERSLSSNGLPPSLLKLEITEGIVIQNLEDTIGKMHALRQLGVSFAMDDFGTGYSSLTYLKRLPVEVLKIDQAFVRDCTHDPNDAEIIRAILAIAASLKLTVIAEGVELPEQLEFLERLGCHLYQGYLYSRPLPWPGFRALLLHG
ncbi:putative bifunctional diguanylate cyclase/phosphodiesterase [Pseudomonas sp. KNUC1026]|uniref:putative bifunctional diguanylate cyclase/phosphodiesterase n=1 Tax=Pseudomonas sp. KNUC1026 TaxID=2893890 RepID=UPI002E351169|nr:bifunctional diguanylate cyclase/phosphodiesterase [Pseudomonas sp. KNUC1026]